VLVLVITLVFELRRFTRAVRHHARARATLIVMCIRIELELVCLVPRA
jgi:hypothetical protein